MKQGAPRGSGSAEQEVKAEGQAVVAFACCGAWYLLSAWPIHSRLSLDQQCCWRCR